MQLLAPSFGATRLARSGFSLPFFGATRGACPGLFVFCYMVPKPPSPRPSPQLSTPCSQTRPGKLQGVLDLIVAKNAQLIGFDNDIQDTLHDDEFEADLTTAYEYEEVSYAQTTVGTPEHTVQECSECLTSEEKRRLLRRISCAFAEPKATTAPMIAKPPEPFNAADVRDKFGLRYAT